MLTPTLFKSHNRDLAGEIVGALFPGYFKWGLVWGAIAFVALFFSSTIKYKTIAAILIAIMLAVTAVQAFVIEPKASALAKEIPSFETTSKDDPLRIQFRKLHSISAASNMVVIVGGIVLILLF